MLTCAPSIYRHSCQNRFPSKAKINVILYCSEHVLLQYYRLGGKNNKYKKVPWRFWNRSLKRGLLNWDKNASLKWRSLPKIFSCLFFFLFCLRYPWQHQSVTQNSHEEKRGALAPQCHNIRYHFMLFICLYWRILFYDALWAALKLVTVSSSLMCLCQMYVRWLLPGTAGRQVSPFKFLQQK